MINFSNGTWRLGYSGRWEPTIQSLLGITFSKVENKDNEELIFSCDDGDFIFYHAQDCCEHVSIEDIVGDLSDLVGSPLLVAEESSSDENPPNKEWVESFTWTFYKFATAKGYVDIRWLGASNGYYSERVHLRFVKKEK